MERNKGTGGRVFKYQLACAFSRLKVGELEHAFYCHVTEGLEKIKEKVQGNWVKRVLILFKSGVEMNGGAGCLGLACEQKQSRKMKEVKKVPGHFEGEDVLRLW